MLRKIIYTAAACLLAFSISACRAEPESDYEKVEKQLTEMESYAGECDITVHTNKSQSIYQVRQFCKGTGQYRVETMSPDIVAGNVITCNGVTVNHYNSRVGGKVSVSNPGLSEDNVTLVTTFMKYYEQGENVSVYTEALENSQAIVLEAEIPGGHPYYAKGKLWVDTQTRKPVKLTIYDQDDAERTVVSYLRFEYNVQLEDSAFE